MSIINNLLNLLNQSNINQKELCSYLGVGTSTVSNWKTRGSDPPAKYIIPICEFLNVSPEYLLTGEERIVPTTHEKETLLLTDIENKLIIDFRNLSQQGKDYICQQMFMAREVYKKDILSETDLNVG